MLPTVLPIDRNILGRSLGPTTMIATHATTSSSVQPISNKDYTSKKEESVKRQFPAAKDKIKSWHKLTFFDFFLCRGYRFIGILIDCFCHLGIFFFQAFFEGIDTFGNIAH